MSQQEKTKVTAVNRNTHMNQNNIPSFNTIESAQYGFNPS